MADRVGPRLDMTDCIQKPPFYFGLYICPLPHTVNSKQMRHLVHEATYTPASSIRYTYVAPISLAATDMTGLLAVY